MPTIALLNYSTAGLPWSMNQLAASLQEYVNLYVGPAWNVAATVEVIDPPPTSAALTLTLAGRWPLYLMDDSDVAGAEGYHDNVDQVQGFAFLKTTMAAGDDPAVTVSHEFAEMLVDPLCNYYTPGPKRGQFSIVEIADPVEGDSFVIGGIPMSNFILPSWYSSRAIPGTKFDHLGKLTKPFSLDAGGYMSIWTASKGWSQVFGSEAARAHFERFKKLNPLSRYHRRLAKFPAAISRGRPKRSL